jgi:hypothetical protein
LCSDLNKLELCALNFHLRASLLFSSWVSSSIHFLLCACAVFPHHFAALVCNFIGLPCTELFLAQGRAARTPSTAPCSYRISLASSVLACPVAQSACVLRLLHISPQSHVQSLLHSGFFFFLSRFGAASRLSASILTHSSARVLAVDLRGCVPAVAALSPAQLSQ